MQKATQVTKKRVTSSMRADDSMLMANWAKSSKMTIKMTPMMRQAKMEWACACGICSLVLAPQWREMIGCSAETMPMIKVMAGKKNEPPTATPA